MFEPRVMFFLCLKTFFKSIILQKKTIFFKLLSHFHIIFRFLEASKNLMKSKLCLCLLLLVSFFVGQKVNKTVLINSIKKDDK